MSEFNPLFPITLGGRSGYALNLNARACRAIKKKTGKPLLKAYREGAEGTDLDIIGAIIWCGVCEGEWPSEHHPSGKPQESEIIGRLHMVEIKHYLSVIGRAFNDGEEADLAAEE